MTSHMRPKRVRHGKGPQSISGYAGDAWGWPSGVFRCDICLEIRIPPIDVRSQCVRAQTEHRLSPSPYSPTHQREGGQRAQSHADFVDTGDGTRIKGPLKKETWHRHGPQHAQARGGTPTGLGAATQFGVGKTFAKVFPKVAVGSRKAESRAKVAAWG